ncbi:RES family NAD+ phosphorylase [Azotobacter chroococcum]|uniref:RES domain-containing protein n=1 Tax=Azotobacter chroococcum NCIMB 8003 TaxID=1328314 RepID=A0A0C4WLK3_9GAMM|nr:RES family NAD+ phosphorylase [Azotobacter chroococcum]AJE23643.1 RES domain-containing protein [Azotobacter chroococcum NCIMB 8003]
MARRKAAAADAPSSSGEESSTTPVPPASLHTTLTELPSGKVLHRVHQDKYRADQFNPGVQGNARFSPILDKQGNAIPTLYGGTTIDCALMETVFHDVPHTAGFKSFDKGKLAGQVHSTVEVVQPLQLVDLASVPLRKLGVTRKQLIDTEKDQYPATRKWAEAIHSQCPEAQGLSWISRQDDSARAVVLFGDRIPDGVVLHRGPSVSLLEDGNTYDSVLDLADRIGVHIVPGKG